MRSSRKTSSNLPAIRTTVTCLMAAFLIQACATLEPDYEEPTVLLNSFRVIPTAGMMKQQDESLVYEFKAKLDIGGLFPSLRISETGTLDFANQE